MTTIRTRSGRSTIIVEFNDDKAKRVFAKFAGQEASKKADRVLKFAQQEAPVSSAGGRVGGTLQRSIIKTQSRETTGRYATGYDVTANAPYAVFVHEGTRPHKIVGSPVLAFFWPKVGTGVVFASVNHPGTKGNPFLVRALRRAR